MPRTDPAVQIAVLLGAGPRLSSTTRTKLKSLIKEVFSVAQSLLVKASLETDVELVDFTQYLMKTLEDSELTNAGRGSELTMDGTVECDATMALSNGEHGDVFASCGAVPDLMNPICLCSEMIKLQLDSKSRPRSIPNFLVGSAAREYGLRLGLCRGDLATQRARETRKRYLTYTGPSEQRNDLDRYLDTVGLIVINGSKICVSSSSGGPILKDAGRIGPASLYGCGSYAMSGSAAICSGFGEDINSTRLAQTVVQSDRDLGDVLRGPWVQKLQLVTSYFGTVKATTTPDGAAFEWHHTTEAMICGFARVTPSKIDHHLVSSTEPQGGGVHM